MLKKILILVIWFMVQGSGFMVASAQESDSITIVTYYPSPYGVYREMRAQRMAIGDTYINNSVLCWEPPCPFGSTDISDTFDFSGNPTRDIDLVVQGNVGIGTAAMPSDPNQKLELYNGYMRINHLESGVTGLLLRTEASSIFNAPFITWSAPNATTYKNYSIRFKGDDGLYIGRGGNDLGDLFTGQEQIVIKANTGNVGIGTTMPTHKLHLDSSIGVALGLSTDGGVGGAIGSRRLMLGVSALGPDDFVVGSLAGDSVLSAKSGGRLIFGTSVTDAAQSARMTIDTVGNVGIGTTSPDSSKGTGGYLDAKDVYLRDTGKWASEGGGGFGSWESKSVNTVYQATTDGFVSVMAYGAGGNYDAWIGGYTDSSNPPGTLRTASLARDTTMRYGITMPVKKGDYWRIVINVGDGSTAGYSIYWLPIGG